jgi:hypothetical protein
MLTPPFHFSIVACPAATQLQPTQAQTQDDIAGPSQILYRGSIPATRNLPFLKRLGLKTVVYCRKKELKVDDVLVRWAKKRAIDLRWVKAEGMGEEKLGMGKTEIGDVLKVSADSRGRKLTIQTVLDPSCYPLYIADLDGVSHTTLIVACLRKLQGWHLDSIINEITRFEPEYEDLPLIAFINAYLVPSSDTPFTLPSPPYPAWLWPSNPANIPPTSTSARPHSRERTSSSAGSTPTSILPFPHPLTARRHPTMKLTFPAAPAAPPAPASVSSQSPQLAAQNPNVNLSRVSSIRSPAIKPVDPEHPGLVGAATNLISTGLSRVASAVGGVDAQSKRLSRNVSFENDEAYHEWRGRTTGPTSPDGLSRQMTIASSDEESDVEVEVPTGGREGEEQDGDEEDDEEDEDEEEEDEEEEEEDEDVQPPSQYISALDLAGF